MTDNKMSKHKAAAEIIDTHRSIWCADGEGLVCLCDDWGVEVHDGPDDPRPDSIGALAAHAEHVLSALADAGYQVTRLPEAIAEVKVQIYTTRLRKEWTDKVLNEYGTISRIADVAEVDVSTISRWRWNLSPGRRTRTTASSGSGPGRSARASWPSYPAMPRP